MRAALLSMLVSVVSARAAKPNIVWIMADDMGFGEVGSFPATSAVGRIRTPHLDQLADSGLKFSRAYAGYTVCAPSRTTLMTGVHSGHFQARGFSGQSIAPNQATTVADVLKAAGYATALFGKAAPLSDPLGSGFDAFVGQVDQGACHDMYPAAIDSGAKPNLTIAPSDLGENPGWGDVALGNANASRDACMAHPDRYNYTTDVFHGAAMAWLRDGRAEPFFLYLSFTTPHAGGWTANKAARQSASPTMPLVSCRARRRTATRRRRRSRTIPTDRGPTWSATTRAPSLTSTRGSASSSPTSTRTWR